MKYCTVTGSMTKGLSIESNNHMCAERQIIKQLYRECFKRGYKSHQFSEWVHRKYGHLVICRKTVEGDAVSLPCALCRKAMERHDICWIAHDGEKWVHSKKTEKLPPSIPTAKQKRNLGFGSYNKSQS